MPLTPSISFNVHHTQHIQVADWLGYSSLYHYSIQSHLMSYYLTSSHLITCPHLSHITSCHLISYHLTSSPVIFSVCSASFCQYLKVTCIIIDFSFQASEVSSKLSVPSVVMPCSSQSNFLAACLKVQKTTVMRIILYHNCIPCLQNYFRKEKTNFHDFKWLECNIAENELNQNCNWI